MESDSIQKIKRPGRKPSAEFKKEDVLAYVVANFISGQGKSENILKNMNI